MVLTNTDLEEFHVEHVSLTTTKILSWVDASQAFAA